MIRIKATKHFADMVQYREISIDHVKKAIREPDLRQPTYDGKVKVKKEIDANRSITVIFYREGFKDANDHVIVTAYYTSNE